MALYTESRMFNPIKVKGISGLNWHLRGLEPGNGQEGVSGERDNSEETLTIV